MHAKPATTLWRRHRNLFLLLGVAAALAALVGGMAQDREAAEPRAAVPSPPGGIVVRGRLEPSEGVFSVAAFSSAPTTALGDVLVAQGQAVKKGDVVATLRTHTQAMAAVDAAKASLEVTERRLDVTRHPFKEATLAAQQAAVQARVADVNLAQAQIQRSEILRKRGIVSDESNDLRAAQMARANASLEEARDHLAAVKEVPQNEILLAETEVAAARARLRVAQEELGLTEIRAPADGTVLKILAKSGELVSDRAIMDIGDLAHLKVVAEVDERLISRVRPGQLVHASARGVAGEWTARVSRIGNLVQAQTRPPPDTVGGSAGRIVEVDATLTNATGLPLFTGLELLVHIEAP